MKSEKITLPEESAPKRWYQDACGAALALEFVGERWSLLVMRELMLGPRRFSELRADLTGISANVLTQRLAGLGRSGIVRRRMLPPPAGDRDAGQHQHQDQDQTGPQGRSLAGGGVDRAHPSRPIGYRR